MTDNGVAPVMDEDEAVAPPEGVTFELSRLSYGDLRRLQTVDATNPAGLELLDTILEKAVVGGLDAIPVLQLRQTMTALMQAITAGMSGSGS